MICIARLLSITLAATLSCAAVAEEMVLKFGHVGAPGSLFDISANEFARLANERLAGRAKVEVFGSSQLGKDKELLQKLKLGTVDFALPLTVMSTVADKQAFIDASRSIYDEFSAEVPGEGDLVKNAQSLAQGG